MISAADELARALRALCLAFPEAQEHLAHGMPQFRAGSGKTFVIYAANHHGDGRIALWLPMPDGVQDAHVREDAKHFFVPPYVGPAGWLGVRLDRGIAWGRVCELVRMSYEHVAPARLASRIERTPKVPAPRRRPTAADVDPANSPRGKRLLAILRETCLALPATQEDKQFGAPVWRVGKRVFARAYCHAERWQFEVWVGVAAQSLMTADPRFSIPQYTGHRGWIALDVSRSQPRAELRALARESWRHFAPKRLAASV